jgi:hypothetical protein
LKDIMEGCYWLGTTREITMLSNLRVPKTKYILQCTKQVKSVHHTQMLRCQMWSLWSIGSEKYANQPSTKMLRPWNFQDTKQIIEYHSISEGLWCFT